MAIFRTMPRWSCCAPTDFVAAEPLHATAKPRIAQTTIGVHRQRIRRILRKIGGGARKLAGLELALYQREALLWDSRWVREDRDSLRGRDRSFVAAVLVGYPRKNRSSQSSQR